MELFRCVDRMAGTEMEVSLEVSVNLAIGLEDLRMMSSKPWENSPRTRSFTVQLHIANQLLRSSQSW